MPVTAELSLYRGIRPNTKGNIYYPFYKPSAFVDSISSKKLTTIAMDGYRINNGTAIVSDVNEEFVSSNMKAVSYVIEKRVLSEGFEPVYEFYHVTRIYRQADKAYLVLEADNFANAFSHSYVSSIRIAGKYEYYSLLEMSDIHVDRVSRGKLDIGTINKKLTYDGQALTTGDYQFTDNLFDYSSYYSLYALAKIDAVVTTDTWSNNAITTSVYVVFDVAGLYAKFNKAYQDKWGTDLYPYNGLEIVQDMLGGIFEGAMFSETTGQTRQMRCGGIYVVPAEFLPYQTMSVDSSLNFNMHIKSGLSGYEGWARGQQLRMGRYVSGIPFTTGSDSYCAVPFIGTRGQWMELPRRYKYDSLYMTCDASSGGIQITCRQGKNEVDMTNAFMLPLSTSNDIDTESKQALNGITNGIGIATTFLKQAMKGPLSAGLSAYSSIMKTAEQNSVKSNSTEGNAFITYMPAQSEGETEADYVDKCHEQWAYPIVLAYVDDIADGSQYVRDNGVATDDTYTDKNFLTTIAGYTFLGLSSYVGTETYVRATMRVTGAPEQECKAVEDAFKEGVKYIYVS